MGAYSHDVWHAHVPFPRVSSSFVHFILSKGVLNFSHCQPLVKILKIGPTTTVGQQTNKQEINKMNEMKHKTITSRSMK